MAPLFFNFFVHKSADSSVERARRSVVNLNQAGCAWREKICRGLKKMKEYLKKMWLV